ncbi:ImmA/IrrE family metallo-endopeptidase (plasmid) [Azospirillum sp. 412522]|nr:XRE family transcriptional regulator [Azospirillum sp. 412522]MBY6266610.1 ImmA/IrrE family metallo-endopeptidase [Azospirillum sp. 412522]
MAFTTKGFGGKLRHLRESFGHTQAVVSQRTGIALEALQGMENGTALPTGDEVLILADVYRCDFTWLIEDSATNPDEAASMMLRSESGRIAASDRPAIADFLHLCKSQALIEDLSGRPSFAKEFVFQPRGGYYKGHGIDCAKELRNFHGLPGNAVIRDIFGWLRSSGLRVFRRELPNSSISGLFIRHPEAGRCILINASEDIYRQRFSAAHEAGHAIMDVDTAYNVSEEGDQSSGQLVEIRASTFASCLLIPADLLKRFGDPGDWRNPNKIAEVAGKLFVSVSALLSALKRERILDQNEVDDIRRLVPRLNDKPDPELMGDLSPRERERKTSMMALGLHSVYVQQVLDACRDGLVSRAKAADMLLVEPADMQEIATLFRTVPHHG